jgi:uncharacterized protein YyaL (SSP411 family)
MISLRGKLLLCACLAMPLMGMAESNVSHSHTNRLAQEKSPYLLQHAHNPVDWFPWGEEAFAKARKEGKPIFLSIGYATCHWCHVMEKECFEDEEIGALMNRLFVSIKVDREERPDVDAVYMRIASALSGSGGWPLTIIMTPDGTPYFAGTFFPKHRKYGIEGLMTLLPRLSQEVHDGSSAVNQALERVERLLAPRRPIVLPPPGEIEVDLDETCAVMAGIVDPVFGGTGSGMKFPNSHQLLYMLEHARRTGDAAAMAAVKLTLDNIRYGGIYDHIGFGIHRYTVDGVWFVPHFEKMLYNQAQIALSAARYYALTGDREIRSMAENVYRYVLRDMTSPEGAFYSAEDADSEGEEGLFYLWTYDELQKHLSPDELDLFSSVFTIEKEGNWIDRTSNERQPNNILRILPEGRQALGQFTPEQTTRMETIRKRLLKIREKRPRPLLDDKVLTDWNGLMIASMAESGRLLADPELIEAAKKAYAFITAKLYRDRRLLHRWRDGEAAIPGMLSDHTFLAWGALELYRCTQDIQYLDHACSLMDSVIADFKSDDGGFNMVSKHAEQLLFNPSKFNDRAIPSGNAVALLVLTRLARYTGVEDYEQERQALDALFVLSLPGGIDRRTISTMAMEEQRGTSFEVVLVSPGDAKDAAAMLQPFGAVGRQNIYLHVKTAANAKALARLAPFTRDHNALDKKATAYICTNFACQAPLTDPAKVAERLRPRE